MARRRPSRHGFGHVVRATLAAAGLTLAIPAIANAHATLVSSEPAAGSALRSSPQRVRLLFNEPVESSLGQITLIAARGATIALHASGDPHDVHALVAPVDSLGPGTYRVVWRVVSADGHPVSGSLLFTVGNSALDTAAGRAIAPPEPPPPSDETMALGPVIGGAPVLAAFLRGAGLWCLMTLGGLMSFLVWVSPARSQRATRFAVALATAAPILLAAHLAVWLADTAPGHRLDAAWANAALATHTGHAEVARCTLALLALWALWLARRMSLALLFTFGALVLSSAIGHAAAIHPVWSVPLKAIHLLAAAAWIGGLAWLVVDVRRGSGSYLSDVQRVSTIALVAVVVVLITGVAETVLFAPSPRSLLSSAYGALVITKLIGLGVLVGFGAHHRRYNLPRLRRGVGVLDFRRSVGWEVGVTGLVVLLGGWLAYVAPPTVGPNQSFATHSPTKGLPK